jgi:sarcosine oxidase subunit alpha
MYTNPWSKLEVGKCRYGLMLDENGMVFDDGVTVRLGEQHYVMTTTTGGAARVLNWMERWLQTEWPNLKVHLTSVTDHWATFAVVGPKSRKVLQKVCKDIDFANGAFPFMTYREGTVAGVPARVMRISFSGELAYEVNVPANFGRGVWEALMAAGADFDITPYGTETMHVLRAEKGYIIVGQDTDGSITPFDLGMGGMVAKKDCLGKRSLSRTDTAKAGRKQFVGLRSIDPRVVLTEERRSCRPHAARHQADARSRHVELHEPDPGAPNCARGDQGRLEQNGTKGVRLDVRHAVRRG